MKVRGGKVGLPRSVLSGAYDKEALIHEEALDLAVYGKLQFRRTRAKGSTCGDQNFFTLPSHHSVQVTNI